VFADGLGLLPYSNGVHDSLDDQPRRRVYREYVASGKLPAGYATEDGVGLHYIGTELHEAVAMVDGARAWWVEPSPGGGYRDRPIPPRRLALFMAYIWICALYARHSGPVQFAGAIVINARSGPKKRLNTSSSRFLAM
jgi:hypothetical protein